MAASGTSSKRTPMPGYEDEIPFKQLSAEDVRRLRDEWQVELIATVLDDTAEPLAHATKPLRLGLLFGNEADGLDARWLELCDRRLTIPMQEGTDSLNVAIAAGIFLHYFSSRSR